MHLHHTSTQQQRADARSSTRKRRMSAQLNLPGTQRADRIGGAGRYLRLGARSRIHEAKTAIIAQMRELDHPVTSKELYARLERRWSFKAIEYHLSTLVNTGVVEIVFGPELHFSLTENGTKGSTKERCRR
jgi:predicted HTH transcriptional regulator